MPSASAGLPSWLPGLWTREWIDRRGARSDLLDVRYLQTPTLFGDMRIRRDRPAFPKATSFADLSDADLLVLAKQHGFAGITTYSGEVATWHHEIDFQPPDSSADVGRVERVDDDHMLEHATDSSYTESWRSLGKAEGKYLAIRVERNGRLDRMLLIAGDRFLFVHNRRVSLPPAESIESLIAGTHATRAQIIEYLDCEFSSGRIRSGAVPWEVERSTLPWKEGKRLAFADDVLVTDAGEFVLIYASPVQLTIPVNTLTIAERVALFPSRR